MMIGRIFAACAMLMPGVAMANDSIAELGTGGLVLSRTDAIRMEKEDLFISMEEIRVDYVFRNETDADVEATVAFPMPDINANPYSMPALPDDTSDNFLGFTVSVDGKDVAPQLEQKAFALGIDVTPLLRENNVPVNPFIDAVYKALAALPEETAREWLDRGLIVIDSYDDGSGWKHVRSPLWSLKSTYWWKSRFPANSQVRVAHRYKPSVGGSVGLNFFGGGEFQDAYADYKARYCIDEAFEKAIRRAAAKGTDGYPALSETRIDYVLTSGGNWALGNIGTFTLTVDKGSPKNLVSFCGPDIRKTGPTTFVASATDFSPDRDVEILILQAADSSETPADQGEESKKLP